MGQPQENAAFLCCTSQTKHMKKIIFGIDIGGSSVKIGVFDEGISLLEKWSVSSLHQTIEDIVASVSGSIIRYLAAKNIANDAVLGIGIASPGIIDSKKGLVIYSNNIVIENLPLLAMFQRYLPFPMRIANDGCAAALAQIDKDTQNFLLLTL